MTPEKDAQFAVRQLFNETADRDHQKWMANLCQIRSDAIIKAPFKNSVTVVGTELNALSQSAPVKKFVHQLK
jgi:hypothetical protein